MSQGDRKTRNGDTSLVGPALVPYLMVTHYTRARAYVRSYDIASIGLRKGRFNIRKPEYEKCVLDDLGVVARFAPPLKTWLPPFHGVFFMRGCGNSFGRGGSEASLGRGGRGALQ